MKLSPNVRFMKNYHDNYKYQFYEIFGNIDCIVHRVNGENVFEIIPANVSSFDGLTKSFDKFIHNVPKEFIDTVDITGNKDENVGIGSVRLSTHNRDFANFVERVIKSINIPQFLDIYDENGKKTHCYHSVADYIRFMEYQQGGEHYPHYDCDFEIDENIITKYTLVMYFTDNPNDGEFVFVKDKDGVNPSEINIKNVFDYDWTEQAKDDEVLLKINPSVGKIIIFPHSLCHSVLKTNNPRKIARLDIAMGVANNE